MDGLSTHDEYHVQYVTMRKERRNMRVLCLLSPFWLRLAYFFSVSLIGFLLLTVLPMKHFSIPRPSHLDLFFMSVSATTVSSMDTVEMESFSNSQLIILTLLMLFGGEVFTSMIGLLFLNLNYKQQNLIDNDQHEMLELGKASISLAKPNKILNRRRSMRYLWYVVLGYLVVVHAFGCAAIMAYLRLVPAARAILVQKGMRLDIFALFTVVSSFANCGFLPANENMVLFRTNPGILMMVSALILLGNTMYPVALRAAVWSLRRMSKKKEEFEVMLNEDHEPFLMSGPQTAMLGATVGGLILVQVVVFCCLEWGSAGLDGMSSYQKVVGSLFMSINARHAGESIVDLATLSPAILVLYIVMM